MSRAEQRRRDKADKKDRKRAEAILKQIGFPEFQMPPVQMRISDLSVQEAEARTGTKAVILEQWKREQTEKIKKACIIEAQEKLDKAEENAAMCNVIASLKSLDGFRYAKAAAQHIVDNFSHGLDCVKNRDEAKESCRDLLDRYGIDMGFDVPDINKLMEFDTVDWIQEYCKTKIPQSVYNRIWDDSENIQAAMMQVATAWELCKDFGFAKHDAKMMERFWKGFREKYDSIDLSKHGISNTCKALKEKYDLEIRFPEYMRKSIERFEL